LKEIAACTTAPGREMIMLAKKFVEDNYGADVIYGDTDSIFCKFPLKDEEGNIVLGKDALPYAIKMGKIVEKEIAKIMPKPQKLNYEKSLYPFILLSKKRYVGNLYEMDVNKFKQKSMGIVLKRRDNANIVKKIYGGIIDIILNSQDLDQSIRFLREELSDLVNGKADIKDLILSKTLKSSYKDPTKIAHKVLADRIGIRDAGNKPACNDRIAYIYIKNPGAKLQGDKIETPEFIKENKLEPDYLHYITNQIMKPILQLYALCLTDLDDYKESYDYWDKIDDELKLKPLYQDPIKRKRRLDNLKLVKVQELLFDEYIICLFR
jgi:DNA polymerase elongation subunit (family B)